MCGITGFFGNNNAAARTITSLQAMKERGTDYCGIATEKKIVFAKTPKELPALKGKNVLGHCLHSVVGALQQPLKQKGFFAANCEIYNWKELAKKHNIAAKNDAELLLALLEQSNEKKFLQVLEELDGVWAFAYWHNKKVFLSRDIVGEKPLWYSIEKGFCFASEKKALEATGCKNIVELNPRHVLVFGQKTKKLFFLKRKFFAAKANNISKQEKKHELFCLLEQAVAKRVPEKEFGLLYSGGIDSLLLAALFKKMGLKFKCYFGFVETGKEPKDLANAKKNAELLGLELETVSIAEKELPGLLEKIVPLIESSNPIKIGVAIPFFLACKKAREQGKKVIFSGLGADELFAGYARFKESNNTALDSKNLLLQMHENDLYRDDVITMNNNLELRLPFLDLKLIKFALGLEKNDLFDAQQNKKILRETAIEIGIPAALAQRKKLAAQYGSNSDNAIERLAKQAGTKGKADYLAGFAKQKNLKLAALFSGGKDSCLALWLLQRQNYDVCCLVSILPKTHDSFMYHKPDKKILGLQAKALEIPLLIEKTSAKKEKELFALEKALEKAKKKFGIQGVVSGALYSNYQRERIQNICDRLQLKLFSPLWHKKQGAELQELLDNKFDFVFSKIAALGLNEKWLGVKITKQHLLELEELNKKFGLNVAGEGGEFESLVLDAPNFKKRIKIVSAMAVMQNEFSGLLKIKKALLEKK